MRITGSCGIRLACPSCLLGAVVSVPLGDAGCARPASRVVWRFASRLCLLDVSAVCLDTIAPSSHRSRAWFRAVSPCVPRLCFAVISSLVSSHGASRYPPRLIDTTGGEIRRCCGCSLGFACLLPSAHHLIRAVRHRMATGFGACLAPWPSSVPPANRSLAQSDFLAVLSSYRPIISSFLSPITRHGGRGGLSCSFDCLPVRLVRYCRSISPAVDLRGFCGGRRRGLLCLLGCRIMYVVDGVMW